VISLQHRRCFQHSNVACPQRSARTMLGVASTYRAEGSRSKIRAEKGAEMLPVLGGESKNVSNTWASFSSVITASGYSDQTRPQPAWRPRAPARGSRSTSPRAARPSRAAGGASGAYRGCCRACASSRAAHGSSECRHLLRCRCLKAGRGSDGRISRAATEASARLPPGSVAPSRCRQSRVRMGTGRPSSCATARRPCS